jgi:hypothetical protein
MKRKVGLTAREVARSILKKLSEEEKEHVVKRAIREEQELDRYILSLMKLLSVREYINPRFGSQQMEADTFMMRQEAQRAFEAVVARIQAEIKVKHRVRRSGRKNKGVH